MESNQFLDGAHSAPKCLPSSCLVQSLQVKPDDCWIASRVKYHLYSTQNNARNVQTSPAEHCSNHICSGNFFQGRRNPEEFQNLVIRLGGFHIALHYLALIGKWLRGCVYRVWPLRIELYYGTIAGKIIQQGN